jgi:uncharacterized delta-60 repeat protein
LASRLLRIALAVAALVLVLGVAPAVSQAPAPSLSVDTKFSPPDGVARDDLSGNLTDIPGAVAVDGNRIYTVGEARDGSSDSDVGIVARRTDGLLDQGFSGDGKLILKLGADIGKDVGVSVAVLPDHRVRILASTDTMAGTQTNIDAAIVGLNADGTYDGSFGQNGVVRFGVGSGQTADTPTRMTIAPDGRIAVVGATQNAQTKEDSWVSLRQADGSPAPGFGTGGVRIIDRAGAALNDRAVDVAFRPGGGLVTLLQVETNPDSAINDYQAVLRAVTDSADDDGRFSDDGDLVLGVGQPDTIPGAVVAYDGRIWASGATHQGQDTDAFIARMNPDGGGFESRRYDMRGTQIGQDQVVTSSGSDIAVVAGPPATMVITGSINYGSRPYWAGVAFNNLGGSLADMRAGDVIVPTDEYGAIVGVAPGGDDWVAIAGSLVDTQQNFDTSFGTARLLLDTEKKCDLALSVPRPLEIGIAPGGTAPVDIQIRNAGSRACGGSVSVPAPYALRSGGATGPIRVPVLDPGTSKTYTADLSYGGPRVRDDVLTFTVVASPADSNAQNDSQRVKVLFDFCDPAMRVIGKKLDFPSEGGRRVEFLLRNTGTIDCERLEVRAGAGARRLSAADRFTLRRGRSASETVSLGLAKKVKPGRTTTLQARAVADRAANTGTDDVATITARVVGVGDSAARSASSRRFGGTASSGRGGASKARLRLRSVQIAVQRKSGKRCRWLTGTSGRMSAPRSCSNPRWLRASGTSRWSYVLRRALPAGSYVVRSRAVIRAGFAEASFSRRDGNLHSFRAR